MSIDVRDLVDVGRVGCGSQAKISYEIDLWS